MSILIKEDERYISNCTFSLQSNLDHNFKFDINEFSKFILSNYWKLTYFRHKKTSAYRILRAKLIKNRYLVLYMQYSNSIASNPAFANLQNGKSRIVKKGTDEGIACSTHLVIDTEETSVPNRFNAVLEDMQGLSAKAVCSLINHLTRQYKVQDPNDEKILHKPNANITFIAKNNFEEQLNEGKIASIVAFKESVQLSSEMDDDTQTIKYKEVHRLEFSKNSFFTDPIEYIAKAAGFAKEKGFYKLKITHENNNKQQSANYELDNNISNEELYEDIRLYPFVSKNQIILDKPRDICNHMWCSQIIRAMITQLDT